MKNKIGKVLNLILPVIVIVSIFIVWASASNNIDNQYILPSVKATAEEFFALFKSGEFCLSFLKTLGRALTAFVLSFVISFALSILSAKIKYVHSAILPVISVMRALPTIAVVLLLLLWTNSFVAPVIVTLLVVLPTCYTNLENAFWSLDKTIAEAGRVDGANEMQVFLKVELPMIANNLLSTIGSGISLSFKLMVAAEVLSQTATSIGYMLNTSKVYFETAKMMALVLSAVIFGVLIEWLFNKLAKKVSSWK